MKSIFIMKRVFMTLLLFLWLSILGLPYFSHAAEQDFSFADAARLAVEASDELRNEYAARALREGAWKWGVRAYFPRLSLIASEDDRLSLTGSDSFHKNYSVNVDQLLWDGGRIFLSRKMERTELELGGNKLKQMASDLGEAVVSAYREVLMGRNILEIREKTRTFLDEQLRIMVREAELGLIRPTDLLEARITAALSELDSLSLAMDLEEIESRLADKLGLEKLPSLSERIDTERSPALPNPNAARVLAEAKNQDLAILRYSVARRQAELRVASLSWVPSLRLTGTFGLGGQNYPLSRYNWSVGLVIEFSSPWLSGNFSGSTGWDPPYDRNARLQQTAVPAPDPAAMFSIRAAKLALSQERSRYEAAIREVHSAAERGIKACTLLDRKRGLAKEALELEGERFRLAELRLSLGEITRLDLMEMRLGYEKREAALVEAAAALLEAERQLERLLDLAPGELASIKEL